ncbi:MAG TPA: hypothetical protein VGF91_24770 [Solirubrobacteraceae bacterium]
MLSRFAGRLVTGAGAFFVAGVIDVTVSLGAYLRWLASARRPTPPS